MEQIKSVEDVVKWSVTNQTKVMLVRNIIAGKLQLDDPELVEYLKAQTLSKKESEPQSEPQLEPQSEPQYDVLYTAENIITNMVMFNNYICFTIRGDEEIYTLNPLTKEFGQGFRTGSKNVTGLTVGNGYLYSGDETGQVIVWTTNWTMGNKFHIPNKFPITAMHADSGKLYVGNNQGTLYMFDALGNDKVSFDTQLPGSTTHIIKFNSFLIWTSNHEFRIESLADPEKPKYHGVGNTNGKILSVTVEGEYLSIYTDAGRVQLDSSGTIARKDGTDDVYGNYASFERVTYVMNHNGRILNAHGGSIFNKKQTEIVSHTPPKIGNNNHIIALIHDGVLYSTGADCKLKVNKL